MIFDNIGPFVLSFFRLLQKFKFDDKTKPWAAHRDRLLRPLGTISMAVTHSRRRLAVGRQIKFKDIWFQFFLDLSISLFPLLLPRKVPLPNDLVWLSVGSYISRLVDMPLRVYFFSVFCFLLLVSVMNCFYVDSTTYCVYQLLVHLYLSLLMTST